jgi:hypothetical protein
MNETIAVDEAVKTYRGDSIESLLPQIRAELGGEAVIVSRREGLIGGVGGFFQKRCVEVDARAGGPGVDVYDEEPEGFDEGSSGAGVGGGGVAPGFSLTNSMWCGTTLRLERGWRRRRCRSWWIRRSRSRKC